MELSLIQSQENNRVKRHDTGVILHLYYPDMWNDMLPYLTNLGGQFDLFVTIPYEVDISEDIIRANFPDAQIYRCENRGRDIAPFLVVFSAIAKLGYQYICKIHTKKSSHIVNGVEWQQDMLHKLLGSPKIISEIKKAFDKHPDWGLIAPQGHVTPYNYFWTQNTANVIKLARSVGIPTDNIGFSFVAGSMFWFRPGAFDLLLKTGISTQDFEPEQGQLDGTLAHAFERFFGMAANHAGYKIAESDSHEVRLSEVSFQFRLLIQVFEMLTEVTQSLSAQVAEKEQAVQALTSEGLKKDAVLLQTQTRLAEKEQELAKIIYSKAWKIALLFRRTGAFIAPANSLRTRILQQLINITYRPLSSLFNRIGKKGEQVVLNRGNFDERFYISQYPDVLKSGIDPYQHYQQLGKFEGRLGYHPKLEVQEGFAGFESSKDTILIVSHEASRTGAPILSLNLVQNLQKKYNVVSLVLGDGSIMKYFRDASAFVVGPISLRGNPIFADYAVEQLTGLHEFKFAIVNSVESHVVIPPLAKRFVPVVSLIHEFAAYTRPKGVFFDAIFWSHETIFSASVTYENAIAEYPELRDHSFRIMPQGLCLVPSVENNPISRAKEEDKVLNMLRPDGLPADTIVVLGVGYVQIRKGVDLFIECAARIVQSEHGKHFRFIWIGNGFDPEGDLAYSVYLVEQIRRSGLERQVFFMQETSNIEAAYQAADMLLISSRLDPLPNVAIDAMMRKLPMICFEKTTGIADILTANGLGEECVAPYLDIVKMADKVIAFAQSKSLRQQVGEQLQQTALKEFNMENYVLQLEQIGLASSDYMAQEKADVAEIIKSGLARLDYFIPPHLQMQPDEAIRYYARTWANGLRRRKLFPGFHPGIFLEQRGLDTSSGDPLASYLRAGQPNGAWCYDLITSEETAQPLPLELRIALHLHIYYPDLLPEMLKRLNENRVRPDLFVSVPTETVRNGVRSVLSQRYSGKVIEVQVVPNCGRDIGPFLTAFGAVFVNRYDVVGHIHTKKTADIKYEKMGQDWYTFLLENLLGGKSNMADIILGRLATDPSIGIIFPDDPYIVDWGHNKSYAETLGQQLGLNTLPENLLFPVGTMFWAKVESLLPVFNLGLDWDDYPKEPLPYDGSILHALERLLPLVASNRGFRSVLTNVRGMTR